MRNTRLRRLERTCSPVKAGRTAWFYELGGVVYDGNPQQPGSRVVPAEELERLSAEGVLIITAVGDAYEEQND